MDSYRELVDRLCAGMSKEDADLVKEIVVENKELRLETEKSTKQFHKLSEEFEQERYSMKNKLEMMVHMEAHYTEEIANLQDQLQKDKDQSDSSKTHEMDIRKMKTKTEELSSQLEASREREREMEEKLTQVEEKFSDFRQEQDGKMDQHSLMVSEDYMQLQSQVVTLQDTQATLRDQLEESERNLKMVIQEKTTLQSLVLAKGEEIEEMRAEVSSYCNTLEKAREENIEFRVQLENLQLETADHGKKGNSLFGELDDRRMQAEKRLVTLEEQCITAKHQLVKEKQQHHRLRVQMTTLLQANSSSVSTERLDRMETVISQLRMEKEKLLKKIHNCETTQKDEIDKLLMLQQKSGAGNHKEDYIQFLTAVLQTKQAEITKLKEEIHQQNLSLLMGDDKVIQCNRKILQLETSLDNAQKRARKQNLTIEELQMKYEPEKNQAEVKVGLREKIPMGEEESEGEATFVLKERFLPNPLETTNQSCYSTAMDTTTDRSPEQYRSNVTLNSTDIFGSPPDERGFSLSSELAQADKLFQSGKQVKILDTVSVISSDGAKSDVVREGNDKENCTVPKKGPKGIVHHKVKKVSSAGADRAQCKQQ